MLSKVESPVRDRQVEAGTELEVPSPGSCREGHLPPRVAFAQVHGGPRLPFLSIISVPQKAVRRGMSPPLLPKNNLLCDLEQVTTSLWFVVLV